MDEELREKIRNLAEEKGLDPAVLEAAFLSSEIPQELQEAMTTVVGDVALFEKALSQLDK